jgi:hypothetical protein
MRTCLNAMLSGVLLLGIAAALTLVSSASVIALVPICIIAIVYLNIDSLMALLNGPLDDEAPTATELSRRMRRRPQPVHSGRPRFTRDGRPGKALAD